MICDREENIGLFYLGYGWVLYLTQIVPNWSPQTEANGGQLHARVDFAEKRGLQLSSNTSGIEIARKGFLWKKGKMLMYD